jgi:hypothetical protein
MREHNGGLKCTNRFRGLSFASLKVRVDGGYELLLTIEGVALGFEPVGVR